MPASTSGEVTTGADGGLAAGDVSLMLWLPPCPRRASGAMVPRLMLRVQRATERWMPRLLQHWELVLARLRPQLLLRLCLARARAPLR
jgi:hypothetical protein